MTVDVTHEQGPRAAPVGNAAVPFEHPDIGAQVNFIALAVTFEDVVIGFMINLEPVECDSEDARHRRARLLVLCGCARFSRGRAWKGQRKNQ